MEKIQIIGSHDVFFVPTVDFNPDTRTCLIAGESYLEETLEFYEPLFNWLEKYFVEINAPLTFNIKLTYFNTSSSRCILDILNLLKEYIEQGGEIDLNWFYDPSDSDMIEEVEDYMADIELDINMIVLDDEEIC